MPLKDVWSSYTAAFALAVAIALFIDQRRGQRPQLLAWVAVGALLVAAALSLATQLRLIP